MTQKYTKKMKIKQEHCTHVCLPTSRQNSPKLSICHYFDKDAMDSKKMEPCNAAKSLWSHIHIPTLHRIVSHIGSDRVNDSFCEMDVLWSKDKLYKIFSKDSFPMTINTHASGDGCVMMKCCRLCGGDTSLRSFNEIYVCDGVEQRYDQLLYDCFGVKVYPSDCLICDHCVRQLRNIDRFRTLVHSAFIKQRSEYSSKHSQMGIGEGYSLPLNEIKNNRTCYTKINYTRSKEVVKMRRRSKPCDQPKKKELKRDRRSVMSTNIAVKRMNIACMMCKQRYPMMVPFEGWKEFVCSRCKKNREGKGDRRSSLKLASSVMRERFALSSKADLRGRSRLCCLPKKSTQLSKTEETTRARQQKYKCNLCPKKYVVAQHLAHHMSTVHGTKTDHKNLTCNVCNKDLKSKESLEKHIRMHTGQPVYQCDVCLRSFKGKRSFQTHYLTHGK